MPWRPEIRKRSRQHDDTDSGTMVRDKKYCMTKVENKEKKKAVRDARQRCCAILSQYICNVFIVPDQVVSSRRSVEQVR